MACADCPADLRVHRRPEDAALVIRVGHEQTCPWWRRVTGGQSKLIMRPNALIAHGAKEAA